MVTCLGSSSEGRWSASASIDDATIRFVRCLCGHDVGTRAVAGVGESLLFEAREVLLIDLATFALIVWPFIERKAEPGEVFDQLTCKFGTAALRIDVLDAEHPRPVLTLR